MTQFHHILAATDLSAPARLAAERAALICKDAKCALKLLHVANLSYLDRLGQLVAAAPANLHERVLAAAHTRLHELADYLARRHGVRLENRVVTGALLTEMAQVVKRADVDLVVCGAKGESAVRHALLGSTAQRLLSRVTCPVLVVKQPPFASYRSVLVPVDFSPSSLHAILHAKRLAPDASLTLLHAFEVPFEGHLRYASVEDNVLQHYRYNARKEANRRLEALADAAGLLPYTYRLVVVHGDPTLRIAQQETSQAADLIVMGKHGESLLEDLLLGSVTKYVLAESRCDVLVSMAPGRPEVVASTDAGNTGSLPLCSAFR